jgi:hypothetical protein
MQIEKDKLAEKNKDQKWCTEKINLRKLRWPITSVALKVERATKKKSAKVLITIERSNHHSVTHLADRLEIYGYYEWLEIKEALKKVRSTYRRNVEDILDKLINRVSQHTKLPTIVTKVPDHPSSSKKKRPSGTWTPNFIPPHPSGSLDIPRADTSMLTLELPGEMSLPPGSIIREPEFGIFFLDGYNKLCFQRVEEFPIAPTDHLINVLYFTSQNKMDFVSYGFGNLIRTELKKRQILGENIDFIHIKSEEPDDVVS